MFSYHKPLNYVLFTRHKRKFINDYKRGHSGPKCGIKGLETIVYYIIFETIFFSLKILIKKIYLNMNILYLK